MTSDEFRDIARVLQQAIDRIEALEDEGRMQREDIRQLNEYVNDLLEASD